MGSGFAPGGGAVAASLPTMDWLPGPVERGAGLCVALLAAVENPAEAALGFAPTEALIGFGDTR